MEETKIENITVLGKIFNSEEERRTYFREELRKQLPELKQMEGFPIGEDEDILNLSDPPYYTACPNPWLNDFIAEWEDEKKLLEKEGKRSADFVVDEPYASDVSEGKSNPIYTSHMYHTKVPHPAIMRYLLYYTQPGDIILDSFCGTGMTGVAAQLCNKPDPTLKLKLENEFKSKNVSIQNWGKRRAILNDLSTFAGNVSYNFNSLIDRDVIENEFDSLTKKLIEETKFLYETKHNNEGIGTINYAVWSDVISCSNCNSEIVFWDAAMDHTEKKVLDQFECKNCGQLNSKKTSEVVKITEYDPELGESIKANKQVPVLYVYTFKGKRYTKRPDENDLVKLNQIKQLTIKDFIPKGRMPAGDESRRNDKYGVTHVNHFFTKRNLIALSVLTRLITESRYKNKLSFILTGIIVRSTKMNRVHSKNYFYGGGGWNAGNMKGTLYIPSMPVETSILEQVEDKCKSYKRALSLLNPEYNNLVNVGSATNLGLASDSIDYIFTDPPFGANIMYSELNYIMEAWLKVFTNSKKEAIENKTQNKTLLIYQTLMIESFAEYYRVLKPNSWMTVEFSNTSAAVWNGIQTALTQSGFVIANVGAIDKKQGGMRASTTPTAVRQDLVISCYKPSSEFDIKFKQSFNSDVGVWDFVEEHLKHLPIHLVKDNATTAIIERSPKILFDRLIAFYVQKGLPVPIDAGAFQKGLRDRFIERDGMFFTNEQVQEYDKKKAENPEFIQLSILVSSEQDGVLWLKNVLTEKSLAYQDIQPLWMQALAGVRKGDVIPELADILEENFLKDEQGKWYVPDPENEADLEKLRTKRLLKQFEVYKTEAAKPKGKIKEVRVEALRAGFKQSYQDKDFKTIVEIGDRIPNNLLMEDEVLLQFYDIASSKV
jgi:hypothetical protein